MRRITLVLGAFIALGLVALSAQQAERRIVRMQTLNVRDILYILQAGGGNTLALMRDDGVVLVDTKMPGWGQSIRDTIESVTDKGVTTTKGRKLTELYKMRSGMASVGNNEDEEDEGTPKQVRARARPVQVARVAPPPPPAPVYAPPPVPDQIVVIRGTQKTVEVVGAARPAGAGGIR